MKTLIMLAGVPGSGKSTFAKEYAKTHPNTFVVDTDEVRKKVMGSYHLFPKDRRILYDEMIREGNAFLASQKGDCTLIEDSTFTDNFRRKYYMERLLGYDRSVLYMMKFHDYSICYQRNKQRIKDKWVPDEVITNFIKTYEEPTPEVAALFDEVKEVYGDKESRQKGLKKVK